MRFTFLVAWRILGGVRHRYLSVVSRISIAGVALGVAALVVVLSISDGFGRAFEEKILSLYPHMVVLPRGIGFERHREVARELGAVPGVVEALPSTYDELMAVHRDRRTEVVLKGLPLSGSRLGERLATALDGGGELPQLAMPVSATVEDGVVSLRGGHEGVVAQVLVTGPADAPVARVAQPIWARPSSGFDRVILAGPVAMKLRCRSGGIDREFEIPSGGGFSRPGLLPEGTLSCEAEVGADSPRGEGGEPAGFKLVVKGGWVRTVVLDAQGSPLPGLDVTEPESPADVASSARVYWPERGTFRVRTGPRGETVHEADGERSSWIALPSLPLPGVLLGSTIASRLRAKPGGELRLMTPLRGLEGQGVGPLGMAPTVSRFRVAGVLHSGFHEFDNRFALADLGAVQRFFNRGDVVRWVEVRIGDVGRTDDMVRALRRKLDPYGMPDLLAGLADASTRARRVASGGVSQFPAGPPLGAVDLIERSSRLGRLLRSTALDLGPDPRFKLIDWRRMNQNLLGAIRLQRVVLTIFFLIIVLVAASNVVGTQIMLIHEKTPAIAILRAMGASRRQVQRVFRAQGLFTATSGSIIGVVLGLAACAVLRAYPLDLNAEIYFIESLPVRWSPESVVFVVAATLAGTWLATRFSARRAASLDPVEALHRAD